MEKLFYFTILFFGFLLFFNFNYINAKTIPQITMEWKGEASIYMLPNGKYNARVYVDHDSGCNTISSCNTTFNLESVLDYNAMDDATGQGSALLWWTISSPDFVDPITFQVYENGNIVSKTLNSLNGIKVGIVFNRFSWTEGDSDLTKSIIFVNINDTFYAIPGSSYVPTLDDSSVRFTLPFQENGQEKIISFKRLTNLPNTISDVEIIVDGSQIPLEPTSSPLTPLKDTINLPTKVVNGASISNAYANILFSSLIIISTLIIIFKRK